MFLSRLEKGARSYYQLPATVAGRDQAVGVGRTTVSYYFKAEQSRYTAIAYHYYYFISAAYSLDTYYH